MASFAKYFPLLLANEGGYVFDPHDPGGETWRGVARRFNPQWPGWKLVDAHKAQASWPPNVRVYPRNKLATAILRQDKVLAGLVQSFYQQQYWDKFQLDRLDSQCIASQLCDIGVNSGPKRVVPLAQYVLANSFGWKGALDGKIGSQTISALNAAPPKAYYDALVTARREFYQYRAGNTKGLTAEYITFLQSVRLNPDETMQRYLPSWLGRISAIPFTA